MTRALAVRRTAVAYGVLGLLVAAATYPIWAFTIGAFWGVLISVVLGAGVVALVHHQSDASALRAMGATPLDDGRYPRLNDSFELHVTSFDARAMKPDPAIYRLAAERAGCALERVFFADDRPENVEGALACGVDAVLFTSTDRLAEDLRARGVAW